ncbi:endonuclease/exonuclease/phosphatase family protein [Microbacterium sp. P07]|uniref:endonuclease/exonuclease/phosphatase family protein n=1 Tax=Microbacterium sp. P07 TaxID=3366952 RepID=UPI0037465A9B
MPNRAFRPLPFLVTLVVCIPLAVLVVWPQAFGAQMVPIVSQVVAFRAPLALILGASAAAFAGIALARRRSAVAAALAIALAAASIGHGAILLSRGGGGPEPRGDLTVVAWNTLGGGATPESIARLIAETDADIVSLPETDERAAAEVARLVARDGRRMWVDTAYGESGRSRIPTSVLIAEHLGEYRVDRAAGSTPGLPSAVWKPTDESGPTIVAAHPMPPLPGDLGDWRRGLQWIAAQCGDPDVIVAGDLNATIDHLWGLGDRDGLVGLCRDAASEAHSAAAGTWPTGAPPWLAAPIDHVLVGPAWIARGFRVVTSFDDSGSDHRPIVAVLDAR